MSFFQHTIYKRTLYSKSTKPAHQYYLMPQTKHLIFNSKISPSPTPTPPLLSYIYTTQNKIPLSTSSTSTPHLQQYHYTKLYQNDATTTSTKNNQYNISLHSTPEISYCHTRPNTTIPIHLIILSLNIKKKLNTQQKQHSQHNTCRASLGCCCQISKYK